MESTSRYDVIGRTYSATRRADPRIAAQIDGALGTARTIVNVGAGSGNYEPPTRDVTAVEPSATMLAQRPAAAARAVRAIAEALPFADGSFDAALGVLTVHHWHDLELGLREMQRVAGAQLVFMFEPAFASELWLVRDYFPEILDLGSERAAPGVDRLRALLDVTRVDVVPVPSDCTDGFGGCYWNRPEAYCDPVVQAGMSSFAQLDPAVRERGTRRLAADLASGAWDARYGTLREQTDIDLGYRLVVAGQLP